MIHEQFARTQLLIGEEGLEKLKNAKVAVVGIGGVGSFVVEGLARAGVGHFVLVDNDTVCLSNLNRQLIATRKTIGQYKVDVAKERIIDINPEAEVKTYQEFFLPETKGILEESLSYVVDAVDTVTAKIELVMRAQKMKIPIISCMGTGNKLDPSRLEIADIAKTSVCPLAKVMRKELRNRGITHLKVLYSKEEPIQPKDKANSNEKKGDSAFNDTSRNDARRHQVPGSISFVPSVAGLMIAGEVVKDIIAKK